MGSQLEGENCLSASFNSPQHQTNSNFSNSFNRNNFTFQPLHKKIELYNIRRKQIGLDEITFPKKSKAIRARIRYKKRRLERKIIASTLLEKQEDIRPYASIILLGKSLKGLLDSGASISVLGNSSMELLKECKGDYLPYNSNVKVASGESQKIIGKILCPVTYKNITKKINFYIAPSLSQEVYLGVNFWKAFNIAPHIFNDISEISQDEPNIEDPKMHDLSNTQKNILSQIISEFPSCEELGLGKTHLLTHSIDTGNASPIKQRHYPYSPAMQALIYEEVDRMLASDVIEESNSDWSSPIVLVKKPGKVRLCLDSRKLNTVTKKLAYPLPHIEGLLSRLSDTRFISSVDLKDAFWQIELDGSSREKTAFVVPGRGLFHFKKMPFGLCNAAQRMSQLMDKVIPVKYREYIFVYLDDLLIIAPDFDTHMKMLSICANLLRDANLTINISKSKFCMSELRYLGYVITDGHLQTDISKVVAISEFPLPKSIKQLRRFLGMTGWYRRFIQNYSDVSAPLTDCLKKSKEFTITPEAKKSFEILKQKLISAPLLSNVDYTKPFTIQCDASTSGIGSVLIQSDENDIEHPLYYFSKKLTKAQKSYTITELECLSAVESIKKYRPFIEGHPFKIITDHASLQWLMSQRDLTGRLARWSLKLQGLDFSIEHRSGKENIVPDALSRMYCDSIEDQFVLTPLNLKSTEFESPFYLDLIKSIQEQESRFPDLRILDGYVYKRCNFYSGDPLNDGLTWKLWVPPGLTLQLIQNAHEPPNCAHGGYQKTIMRLRKLYFWPSLSKDVKNYTDKCELCISTKTLNKTSKPEMGQQIKIQRPFQFIYIDFMGPYPRTKAGNCFIFIGLDALTRFPFLVPMRTATSKKVVHFMTNDLFPLIGVPEQIFSDNGSQFLSKLFEGCLAKYGIEHLKTPFYTPQANAAERVNRSVVAAIRAYVNKHSEWDESLHLILAALRSGHHQSLGTSPYFAVFGQHMLYHGSDYKVLKQLDKLGGSEIDIIPQENKMQLIRDFVQKNLVGSHERNKKTYDLRAKPISFKKGDEVWRKNFILSDAQKGITKKFARKFLKARIRNVLGNNRYEIEDPKGDYIGVFHGQNLFRI